MLKVSSFSKKSKAFCRANFVAFSRFCWTELERSRRNVMCWRSLGSARLGPGTKVRAKKYPSPSLLGKNTRSASKESEKEEVSSSSSVGSLGRSGRGIILGGLATSGLSVKWKRSTAEWKTCVFSVSTGTGGGVLERQRPDCVGNGRKVFRGSFLKAGTMRSFGR
ncbi:MAG: hypothetical protein ACD_17C00365G0001 [uncultured bacterium]|nr:MAG: hypothetical protein ACD_17C00365G0001 [uncultured bacterium]